MKAYATQILKVQGATIHSPLTFTDEHPRSSYGLPVALIGMGRDAKGPADLPQVGDYDYGRPITATEIVLDADTPDEALQWIRRAGFIARVRTHEEVSKAASAWVAIGLEHQRRMNAGEIDW